MTKGVTVLNFMSTVGKVIKCRAAVAWAPNEPLVIEEIEVAPPGPHEVRIKIVATGVCHTDAFTLNGREPRDQFPCILGHEGAGIVESVGEGVTVVKPGDHVIPFSLTECRECDGCKSPNTNICAKLSIIPFTCLMPDGTSRFTCRGKSLFHFLRCSTFSQYTVVSDMNVAKITENAPLEKVCLIGCGITTGYGSAINIAKVEEGSTVAIWGLGGVGLATAMGCKTCKAARIIGVDIKDEKFEKAKPFGVTEFVNPKKINKPIHEVLADMTGGGCDYTFECCGNVLTMRDALESCKQGVGVCIIVGVATAGQDIPAGPRNFILGKSMKGGLFGNFKPHASVPRLVDDYLNKKLMVDEFITFTKPLNEVNEAFHLMHAGKTLRTVITMHNA